MSVVKTEVGRTFRFLEHRPAAWNPKVRLAWWSASCADCGKPFEVSTPRIDPVHGRINAQGAFDCNVWRRHFSRARCPSCRAKRKA